MAAGEVLGARELDAVEGRELEQEAGALMPHVQAPATNRAGPRLGAGGGMTVKLPSCRGSGTA